MRRGLASGLVVWAAVAVALTAVASAYELTVVHTNDLHSRFEQVTATGSRCEAKDAEKQRCYGGVARIKHVVDQIKNEEENVVFVNGGDFFQGTVWYSMFKWGVVANLTMPMGYTATSLGNHEFDDGVKDLIAFLDRVQTTYPVLACNVDLSLEPELARRLQPSVVKEVGGRRVGIIGYVTPETKDLASTGKVKFLSEVDSLRKEARRLKAQGVDILIAVGHSGYEVDQEIGKQVEGLDLVVGGHTNTLLWNGTNPISADEVPQGPYPTVVRQQNTGIAVPVVQTSGYGIFLGKLKLKFDGLGRVVEFSGSPVVLDQSKPQDLHLAKLVDLYGKQVAEKMEVEVGSASTVINGSRPFCRIAECGFGNFVTDAMAEEMGVQMALINSGAIKGSFRRGVITMGDVVLAMPWANTVDVVTIPGRTLKLVLEHSVSQFKVIDDDPGGRFLQVSGMTVTYDVDKPVGQRLVSVLAGTAAEGNLAPIDDETSYEIAVLSFMGKGGDGYSMIPENMINYRNSGMLDNDLIVAYLEKHSPVSEPELGRIRLRPGDAVDTAAAKSKSKTSRETASFLFNALVWIVLKIL